MVLVKNEDESNSKPPLNRRRTVERWFIVRTEEVRLEDEQEEQYLKENELSSIREEKLTLQKARPPVTNNRNILNHYNSCI